MKIEISEKRDKSGNIKLMINGEATIYSVGTLKQELTNKYKDSENIVFDFSGITKIDTAGFQLFFLLRKNADSNGREIVYKNPSDEVKRIFDLYGENI